VPARPSSVAGCSVVAGSATAGKAVRAAARDPARAGLSGIAPSDRRQAVDWALSGAERSTT
jgi:branched-subunit amino acid ABC-type transport system permease component